MNIKFKLIALLLSSSLLWSQASNTDVRSRIEGTDRSDALLPSAITQTGEDSSDGELSESDTGAQRPVQLNKDGISAFFGYDSKYFYRSNPLSTNGPLRQSATAMWTNTFYTGAGLGVFDMGESILTPYIGANWTINDYLEGDLGDFNYNSTGAYALLLNQFANGWSARIGVNYLIDRSTKFDTEDFKDVFPNVGVLRAYSINEDTTGVFDASLGFHSSETEPVFAGDTEDALSNLEVTASYGVSYDYGKAKLSPKYKIIYKDYDEGDNIGRSDISHVFSFKIDYLIADSLKLSLYTGYTKRDVSGQNKDGGEHSDDYDYKNWDVGAGIGLNSRF